ncbi:MAG: bifunctional 5,10-methylenetetrahydrofolate dehydrogenase/5,10-methenyltetrahydrofolate cyclohydrolase [Clostridia bacterium]|nr:bifunctional 5,10-methylenetetrahydrofolate dehydrogenase/5,10-methenyltetrahydrofolate cyclohydrolase [Clostridia bacterium]
MAQLLLGREVAAAMTARLRDRAAALREKGIVPGLAVIRCGEAPSDMAYERGAAARAESIGAEVKRCLLPEDVTKEALLAQIDALNRDDSVHGVLMFRPLPRHLRGDAAEICNALSPAKDVDCMTDLSNAGIYLGRRDLGFPPCTPRACMEILDHYGIDPDGKRAVVIGRSLVVGRPLAMMLMSRHATVTICHTHTRDLPAVARDADILVSAAGVPGSLTDECVRPGQTVVDVSINWDPDGINEKGSRGRIVGDAVFEAVEPIVSAITPVPGGVGAVTTSVLLAHVIEAAERRLKAPGKS